MVRNPELHPPYLFGHSLRLKLREHLGMEEERLGICLVPSHPNSWRMSRPLFHKESGGLRLCQSNDPLLFYGTDSCMEGPSLKNTLFICFLRYLCSFLAYSRAGSIVGNASTWLSVRTGCTQDNLRQFTLIDIIYFPFVCTIVLCICSWTNGGIYVYLCGCVA